MSRLIHTGDWHLGAPYPEKAAASAQYLIDRIHDSNSPAFSPDAILFGGDLTDRALHVHSDRLEPFYSLVKNVNCPVVLLQGTMSHEPLGTINNIAALSDSITVIDSPFTLFSNPFFNVMGLPGLSKPQLAKWMKELGSDIDGFADPSSAILELLKSIGDRFIKLSGAKILLGHFTVAGCMTPTGQTMIGSDLEVGLADLSLIGADALLLNHIHKSQEWHEPVFASYSGPPYPTSWGELHQTSFSVFEFDDKTGKMTSFVRIPFPHKPMIKLDVEFNGEQGDGEWFFKCGSPHWPLNNNNLEIKVSYSIPKEIAAQVDDMYVRVLLKKHGIEAAAIERTIRATSRERIADISSKETTKSQYEAVCIAKGEDVRLGSLAKADSIDEQVVRV